jgi:AraC-like DNA-binding protein
VSFLDAKSANAPSCQYRGLAPAPELREHLLCTWTVGPGSGGDETVLPDGAIDILWQERCSPIVVGPRTGAVPSTRAPGTTVVGASFRPGAAPALLGLPADALCDLRVPLDQVWGDDAERLEQRLDGADSAPARLRLIEDELRRRARRAERPDDLVIDAVARLGRCRPRPVRSISRELGISERQLRRRFHAAVGYGPKTLARVLRFQRMLGLARECRRGNLGHLALEAGYADQAHLTSECTKLAGMPPARLLTQRYLLETAPAPDR